MTNHKHDWHVYGGECIGPDLYTAKYAMCDCGAMAIGRRDALIYPLTYIILDANNVEEPMNEELLEKLR